MSLFGRINKRKGKVFCCNENHDIESTGQTKESDFKDSKVKILGSGCDKCNQLELATITALKQLGMDTAVDHVTDFSQIASYSVMTTPALVVDGKVVSYGKVLKVDEVVKLLQKVRG